MIKVFIEVEGESRDRHLYDEKTLAYKGTRRVSLPCPFPYGFILETRAADGDSVDCYIITKDKLISGTIAECEPIGLLELFEDDESDHKVMAAIPGQDVEVDQALLEVLRQYTEGIFAQFPGTTVHVGRILPRQIALRYLQEFREP